MIGKRVTPEDHNTDWGGGGALDTHKAIGRLPKPKSGWTLLFRNGKTRKEKERYTDKIKY